MDATGLAAVLHVIGELRAAVGHSEPRDRSMRLEARRRVEELWMDLARLLDEQRQEELRWYDGWLKRVEDELDKGGNVKTLVELGIKLAERRAAVVRLDSRAVIPPSPDPDVLAAIVDVQLKNEQFEESIARGPSDANR